MDPGEPKEIHGGPTGLPERSRGVLSDIRHFLLHRPEIPTLITFASPEEKQEYGSRILQRLGVSVAPYAILNVHKIGIEAPVCHIFEDLLQWNGDSTCWPNHIAEVARVDDRLESIRLYLLGWSRYPKIIARLSGSPGPPPLFRLNAIEIQRAPHPLDCDNARYLLYDCSGGYPIGFFSMYVRSSIVGEGESEPSQLFLIVGFNFYGREAWSRRNPMSGTWEALHNRVTANVMNRFKKLCEWRFRGIRADHNAPSALRD